MYAHLTGLSSQDMDKEKIRSAIQKALLTDEELEDFRRGTAVWAKDPFEHVPGCISL